MPIYIALTNVSTEGRQAIKEDPARIKANNRAIEAMGVKILAQYATLGQYDFINIFEAPNDDAIFKVALNLTDEELIKYKLWRRRLWMTLLLPQKENSPTLVVSNTKTAALC